MLNAKSSTQCSAIHSNPAGLHYSEISLAKFASNMLPRLPVYFLNVGNLLPLNIKFKEILLLFLENKSYSTLIFEQKISISSPW